MPSAPIYRLIYASHIAPVCQDDLKAALTNIVTRSIVKNRKAKITGLLIAHKGWFVQALEGPRAAVEALAARAVEIAEGGEAYPAGVREIASRIATDLPEKAKTLLTILHRTAVGSGS